MIREIAIFCLLLSCFLTQQVYGQNTPDYFLQKYLSTNNHHSDFLPEPFMETHSGIHWAQSAFLQDIPKDKYGELWYTYERAFDNFDVPKFSLETYLNVSLACVHFRGLFIESDENKGLWQRIMRSSPIMIGAGVHYLADDKVVRNYSTTGYVIKVNNNYYIILPALAIQSKTEFKHTYAAFGYKRELFPYSKDSSKVAFLYTNNDMRLSYRGMDYAKATNLYFTEENQLIKFDDFSLIKLSVMNISQLQKKFGFIPSLDLEVTSYNDELAYLIWYPLGRSLKVDYGKLTITGNGEFVFDTNALYHQTSALISSSGKLLGFDKTKPSQYVLKPEYLPANEILNMIENNKR